MCFDYYRKQHLAMLGMNSRVITKQAAETDDVSHETENVMKKERLRIKSFVRSVLADIVSLTIPYQRL